MILACIDRVLGHLGRRSIAEKAVNTDLLVDIMVNVTHLADMEQQ